MTETCFVCDGDAVLVREPREVRIGSRSAVVEGELMRCGECGEEYFLPGQMQTLQRAAADRIREEEGLLHPEEVRAFRNELGLSQSGFEQLLGVGKKTVVRWERGTVFQGQAVDNLIRLLRSVPEALSEQAGRQGVELLRRGAQTSARTIVPGTVVWIRGFVGVDPFGAASGDRGTIYAHRSFDQLGAMAEADPVPAG